jgi:phosphate transport system substrate-binding protein
MKQKSVVNGIVGLIAITALSACSRPDSTSGETESGYVTVKGSDTMVHLVSAWAEEYMNTTGGQDISVTGGGSGTGIAAIINGTADVAMASRSMKQKEFDLAAKQGVTVKEFVVARDGIAMIIHPDNPIDELTVQQLGDMYTGKIKNWSTVGGPNKPITLLSRESSSGTYVFIQERVLGKKDYAANARLMPATSGIIQAISSEKWSIGYVGLGYALKAGESIKMIAVKEDADSDAVVASVAAVQSGSYAIARPLHLYGKAGANSGFTDFCLGPKGQQIVVDSGYVPVN